MRQERRAPPRAAASASARRPQRPRRAPKSPAGRRAARARRAEDHELLERAGQERGPERFGEAHDEAADERAQEVAHAAQHHHHEGHDVEALAHVGGHVEERRDQRARHRHARRADAEGHGADARHVDADQQRALRLLGERPDRLARVGQAQEAPTARARSAPRPAAATRRGTSTSASRHQERGPRVARPARCGSRPARGRGPGSRRRARAPRVSRSWLCSAACRLGSMTTRWMSTPRPKKSGPVTRIER